MENEQFFKIIVGILTIIVTLILFVLYQKARKVRRGILLIGLRESGKTLTFSQLVHGKYVDTYTSLKENIGDIETKNGKLQIIDIPGHEQLRYKYFDQYKSVARAIVYVIDSGTDLSNMRDAAECLYNILSDPTVLDNKLPVLILCNKGDLENASNYDLLKQKLEEEFALLRVTKTHQLESMDEKSDKAAFLGKEGQKFKFEDLPMKVSFAQVSANRKDENDSHPGFADFKMWLAKVA